MLEESGSRQERDEARAVEQALIQQPRPGEEWWYADEQDQQYLSKESLVLGCSDIRLRLVEQYGSYILNSGRIVRKAKIGDICEIKTPIGLAYVQYAHDGEDTGQLVRVLPAIYSKPA